MCVTKIIDIESYLLILPSYLKIPTGNLLKSLKNHHGLIYDLAWKEVSGVEGSSYYQYLASASADSTVCIWSMKNNNETTLRMVKVSEF